MRKKAKAAAPFSHAEFDALPYSVQRKYFSSLERLRIAEQQEQESYHPICTSRRSSLTHASAIHRSLPFGSARRRLRKAESVKHEHSICQADAQFFLSLPEKVRKQHFSREEQVLLVGRSDHPHLPHDQLLERAQQRFNDFRFGFYNDSDSSSEPERGRSRRRSRSVSSLSPNRLSIRHHQQEKEGDTRSSLIFLDTMSPPLSYQAPPASGFRRTLSLTSVHLRNSTSSAPAMTDPPLFALGPWHQRSHSQSVSGRRSSHAPTTPVFDPEATHYRDPEARKKLRMFLASPQKFDEAVEFGFPSETEEHTSGPRYQLPPITTDARNFSRDMQTFLRDDKVSFLEDNEEEDKGLESDADSMADLDSPITPSSIGLSFPCHTRHASPSNFSSLDSTGLPPMHPMNGRLNREMTLRMTLTRPDLRADEDQLYGWQGQNQKGGKDDPFALEELNLSEDMTGSKGPFYIKPKPHGNLVSRLFKRASRKGR